MNWTSPYLPHVIFGIGLSGCLGMTFILSLLSDVLSVLSLHIYLCYLLATTVFRQQLRLALSLWHLFRGKRYNVLRNRVDSWDYDVDQLLFGTVLFTLVAFLFPTVLVYYTLFVVVSLSICDSFGQMTLSRSDLDSACDYRDVRDTGDSPCVYESFPSFRSYGKDQGSIETARYVILHSLQLFLLRQSTCWLQEAYT